VIKLHSFKTHNSYKNSNYSNNDYRKNFETMGAISKSHQSNFISLNYLQN